MADDRDRTPNVLHGLREIAIYSKRCKERLLEWQERPQDENPFPMFKVGGLWTASKPQIDQWWERELARLGRAA